MPSRILILICFCLATSFSFCQKNHVKKTPPGTVKLNDTLFVDKTEISNINWREYLYYLKRFDSASIEKALPDTAVWEYERRNDTIISAMAEYYLRHPGFSNYPVVGISYEQALEFCQWRTFAANLQCYIEKNNFKDWKEHIKDSFPINFYYRLPSEKEWEMIAAGKLAIERYPYGYDSVYTKWKKKYVKAFNCKFLSDPFVYRHWGAEEQITTPVKSFFRNSSHTYNMIGNVAEMVSEKGIAKGGSFDHTLEDCKIINDQYYTKPERWLGFRCVAVVVR